MRKIEKIIKEARKNLDLLYEIATHDEKTGLYNYKFFKNVFALEIAKAKRGNSLSLIIADIDDFKKRNDKFGHLTGDRILKELARVLKKDLRESDVVARYGGEEFLIMLPETSLKKAFKVAKRIRKEISLDNFLSRYKITISIGISEFRKKDNLAKMLKRADSALLKAKKQGKDRVVLAD